MNNIFVLNKNYKKIGTLSNQGVKPQAPYYNDLYTQELDTGADTYQFSTVSNAYTQDCIEIGNHIMFSYKNRNELFTITSIEYSHSEGYKTIGVYAEGIGFELLEVYMERPKVSNSGGSGGTDNDNDGDDNYDDEYADVDDIYIDANGNIIYDKDGSGLGDVTVDGNGNIIYKRSKNNKNNKNNDSLEFKNISYPTFLNILLKNTGWSFVCQPGLESIKHDITVKYDTNIYAILQDSMQSYRGVELEFVFEYNNGNIKKTLKAYKDGGRGSFIGKRFEYGTNIKGITKTQKVANSKDDTVLYVDDVGIEVFYDVDFALKSAEVPEIEIGDTHYVIDTDFHPPMNIKARIGKIEVSFTDPTKNKIYLANNKKISGAVEEINEDSIKDIIDDYDGDVNHTHDRLVKDGNEVIFNGVSLYPNVHQKYFLGSETNTAWWEGSFIRMMKSIYVNSYNYQLPFDREDMLYVSKIPSTGNGDSITKQDLYDFIINKLNIYQYASKEELGIAEEGENDNYGTHLGILSEDFMKHNSDKDDDCEWEDAAYVMCWNTVSDTDKDGGIGDEETHTGHIYSLSSLVCALIAAFQQHVAGGSIGGGETTVDFLRVHDSIFLASEYYNGNDPAGTYATLTISPDRIHFGAPGMTDSGMIESHYMACEYFKCGPGLDLINSEVEIKDGVLHADEVVMYDKVVFPDGTIVDSSGWSNGAPPSDGSTPSNPGDGGFTDNFDKVRGNELYVYDLYADNASIYYELTAKEIVTTGITFPDGTTLTTANGTGDGSYPNIFDPNASPREDIYVGYVDAGGFNAIEGHIGALSTTQIFGWNNSASDTIEIYGDVEVIGNITAKNISGGTGGGNTFDTITVTKIQGPDRGENQLKIVEFEDAIRVSCISGPEDSEVVEFGNDTFVCMHAGLNIDGGDVNVDGNIYANNFPSSDISLKENIRYIDAASATNDLEKTDLYDFIVNQLNICEYNFIGKDDDKIGFIANEYEGTKVGDKIVSRNKKTNLLAYDISNLLFATIGALQEEVRIKDEKIASLEDRLARIEAMLGINNDN